MHVVAILVNDRNETIGARVDMGDNTVYDMPTKMLKNSNWVFDNATLCRDGHVRSRPKSGKLPRVVKK